MTNMQTARRVLIRCVLGTLHRRLPERAYEWFYNLTFTAYKRLLWIVYGIRRAASRLMGPPDVAEMRMWVHRAMPYSLVGSRGLEATYSLGRSLNARSLGGAFVELGVAQGGAASLLGVNAFATDTPTRHLWLFDSFDGLPDPTKEDYVDGSTGSHVRPLPPGSCFGPYEQVQQLMVDRFSFPRERVHFVKGWFSDTVPLTKAAIGPIAFLRIDSDWYESTRVPLEGLYEQVVRGGVVFIDDYEVCNGCKKAVDEFLQARNESPSLRFDGRGGCYFTKE